MKWAAVGLVALSALCVPTVLQAQDFSADSVTDALKGFGNDFRRSGCFPGGDFRKFQIAVAQMESTKFTNDQLDTISQWVEDALTDDPFFVVAAQRRHWELEEIGKALQEGKLPAAREPLDGIITIESGSGNTIRVIAFAYANGRRTVCASKSFRAGRIVETPDVPEKFFERAATKLPDKTVEQLVVMRPDVEGVVSGLPARALQQRLQEMLADGIKQVFQTRARSNVGNPTLPVVLMFNDGIDLSRAWRADLRARRSPQGGIEVRVDFRGPPDSPSGSLGDRGYLAADIVPDASSPAVIALAEAACTSVRQALDSQTDPDALQNMARGDLCPSLSRELAEKEKFHRERICTEDQAHWREAMTGPVEAMDTAAGKLRCNKVVEEAQTYLRRRKAEEAAVADMKSAAVDLGTLTDGVTVERKVAVGGAAAVGAWKVQLTEVDALEIHLDDLSASVAVELLDSSWKTIAVRSPQGASKLREINTRDRLNPGAYYIRATAADGRQTSFTLRVAKGWIDMAGDTIETARDLGSLGPVTQTYRKRIGGADRGDVYKFAAQERGRLQVVAADMTSDVQVDLMNQSGQVIQSSRGRDRQNVGGPLEAGATYYVAVRAAGGITPYSLSIGLARTAPFSRPDIAAKGFVGGAGAPEAAGDASSTLKHALTANDAEYYARFSLKDPATVSIDLTWQDRQAELWLDLYKEEGGRRLPQKRSVEPNRTSQKVSDRLDPGTYLVRVKRDKGPAAETEFLVRLYGEAPKPDAALTQNDAQQKPVGPKPPGPRPELAPAPMMGNEPVVYTLPANVNDYHSAPFSVTERTNITAVLSWSDRAVDLEMALKDASGKPIVATTGTIPGRTIDRVLEPGTYTVHVYRSLPTSRAAVPLRLTLNRAPPLPPARSSSSQTPPR